MIRKILIYEVHYSNFNRYVLPFAEYLIENGITEEVEMVYDSFVESDKINSSDFTNISHRNVKEAYRVSRKKNNGNLFFLNYSYRIMDLYWTYKFKKIGVRCFQQQHGMYAEFLERSLRGYFSTMPRKITYLKGLLYFLIVGKWGIFTYLLNKDFLKNPNINTLIENRFKNAISHVLSDHVFVWGDYWKSWFITNHFYPSSLPFTTIGNPDYHKFIKGKNRPRKKDKVCYIAQTFVEDGRMDRSEFLSMFNNIANGLKERLIIKLHPRSDRSLYQTVIDNSGELTLDFPLTDFYIGHYSSLLALAINEDTHVFLLEVNNEKIPEYFSESANKVFKEIDKMLSAISAPEQFRANRDISYYFENIEQHPFSIMANVFQEFAKV